VQIIAVIGMVRQGVGGCRATQSIAKKYRLPVEAALDEEVGIGAPAAPEVAQVLHSGHELFANHVAATAGLVAKRS
jgi:hypothetical protein